MDVELSAQTAVIGSMLIDTSCVPALMSQLEPDDFPDATNRHIFEAFRSLYLANKTIDPVTVLAELGSDAYSPTLADMMRLPPTSANCEEYARILRDSSQLRAIQQACWRIGSSEHMDLAQARELLADTAMLLVTSGSRIKRYKYTELIHRFLDRQNSDAPRDFLDFGIPVLNKRVHVSKGDFVILGAYSSVGKTAFALQLGLSVAKHGKRVGFYSYETNEEHAGDRMVANDADVDLQRIKEKKLSGADINRIIYAGQRSELYPFELIESARMNTADLRLDILSHRYEVVFLDYVQLVPGKGTERKDVVQQVSMDLHSMCQELGVTIIALSQVTLPPLKEDKSRRWICMQDLRESKQLLQDGETILLLDLEHPQNRASDRVLIIDKNKDGPTGNFFLTFDARHMRFAYRDPDAEKPGKKKKPPKDEEDEQILGQGRLEDLPDGAGGDLPFKVSILDTERRETD